MKSCFLDHVPLHSPALPWLLALPGAAMAANTNLVFKAELAAKLTYDSNVYLQDVEPSPNVPGAVRPFQESFVLSVIPRVALDYKPGPEFGLGFSYAPEVTRYFAEPSEDYVAHRFGLNLGGKIKNVTWDLPNSFTWIDGSDEGLTFGGPGGAPAIGGIPLRDRRASTVFRDSFKITFPVGRWFIRPAASAYIHDFMTEKRMTLGYQNYVDRNDVNGGIDVGWFAFKDVAFTLGYRFGAQDERPIPNNPYEYSNDYHRLLVGIEGKVGSWLKLGVCAGPDYRDFDKAIPPGFNDHQTVAYIDSTATIIPTKNDTVGLLVRRYLQPGFGAPSIYEDITYDALWRHKFSGKVSATAGFRAYVGDWVPPVLREDWIFTPSTSIGLAFNPHLSGELAYSYDWVDSKVPNTAGREFTRHLGSLSLKYTF